MPRTRVGRLRQVERWLRIRFPPARPTKLQITKPTDGYADITPKGRTLIIRLHPNLRWGIALETLFHEWAHARTWGVKELHHGPAWAAAYGDIYSVFHDQEGCIESRSF